MMEDTRIKFHENEMEYRRNLKWHTLPYTAIRQAYLRIEESRGKLCCGVASFETCFLMLKTDEEETLKIEATTKDIVKQALDILKEKNPAIEIGFKK